MNLVIPGRLDHATWHNKPTMNSKNPTKEGELQDASPAREGLINSQFRSIGVKNTGNLIDRRLNFELIRPSLADGSPLHPFSYNLKVILSIVYTKISRQ
jgi:hypothetical protein